MNFTSTFSARQAVAAALLTDATRTNIFMGRLNQGLGSELLGEHVVLDAQRALPGLRREAGVKTRLIVASMRGWESFVRLAGCDIFHRSVCGFAQLHRARRARSRQAHVAARDVIRGAARILGAGARDPRERASGSRGSGGSSRSSSSFLRDYRSTDDYRDLQDGDALARRFDDAGLGDFFYAPRPPEWRAIRRIKLPDLGSELTRRVALDTLYSLLADGDFDNEQGTIDTALVRHVARPGGARGAPRTTPAGSDALALHRVES